MAKIHDTATYGEYTAELDALWTTWSAWDKLAADRNYAGNQYTAMADAAWAKYKARKDEVKDTLDGYAELAEVQRDIDATMDAMAGRV